MRARERDSQYIRKTTWTCHTKISYKQYRYMRQWDNEINEQTTTRAFTKRVSSANVHLTINPWCLWKLSDPLKACFTWQVEPSPRVPYPKRIPRSVHPDSVILGIDLRAISEVAVPTSSLRLPGFKNVFFFFRHERWLKKGFQTEKQSWWFMMVRWYISQMVHDG